MRTCIYGLGAIGGFVAARMLEHGLEPTAVVRGRTLEVVRERGLQLDEGGRRQSWPLRVALRADELGVQDVVFVSVKTTALADVAAAIGPLIGPDTVIVSAMNGVPWWFFHGLDATLAAGAPLRSIDPHGAIGAAMPEAQVVGCVVHMAAETRGPAQVRHHFGQRFILGDPLQPGSPREARVAELLRAAKLEVETSARIQRDVWLKLWGNMTMNPVSALTGATADRILDDPDALEFMSEAMREAARIGERIGLPIPMTPEERHRITRRLGAFRTSMLQDVDARRPLELDALVGAVIEIGERVGVPTPTIRALMGLARLHAQTLGLYPMPAAAAPAA
ncbi:MAG TPA: 2-dehydropantoate 2-reductase [Burkholderiaceae bacterium]|nr:2-dehydropantoate 2-reductase [Burkholderiaceae bacterium]